MPSFQYSFGFESPMQLINNASFGWDDEDSQAVVIDADDENAALTWGRAIAERFFQLLQGRDTPTWASFMYADEVSPHLDEWHDRQRVHVGIFPEFEPWLRNYEGEQAEAARIRAFED
jgi:hypothetical protein